MTVPATIAYLDCFSGISGDMLLGALLDAGLEKDTLLEELSKIKGIDFQLSLENQIRAGISCKQVQIHSPSRQEFRHLGNILDLLNESDLSSVIIQKASSLFTTLAEAEAKVHNVPVEKIHFHEVGAVDTIVDIVGALVGSKPLASPESPALLSPWAMVLCTVPTENYPCQHLPYVNCYETLPYMVSTRKKNLLLPQELCLRRDLPTLLVECRP